DSLGSNLARTREASVSPRATVCGQIPRLNLAYPLKEPERGAAALRHGTPELFQRSLLGRGLVRSARGHDSGSRRWAESHGARRLAGAEDPRDRGSFATTQARAAPPRPLSFRAQSARQLVANPLAPFDPAGDVVTDVRDGLGLLGDGEKVVERNDAVRLCGGNRQPSADIV